jgi:hypothetical protein
MNPGEPVSVNLAAFVLRLILFDQYIVQSIRFQEFPDLIRTFGLPAVRDLLASQAIKIRCEAVAIGQTGQVKLLENDVSCHAKTQN